MIITLFTDIYYSEARLGMKFPEEWCQAISDGMKGENNPFYGKHHTEETVVQIKNTLKGKMAGEKNPFYGRKHSEESKKKNSENHIGKQVGERHPRSKLTEKDVLEIRLFAQNGISRAILAKQYNVGITAIYKIITRKTWRHI